VWYRHAAALGAVGNVLMMMGANLVGFVIGTEGVEFFVGELFGTIQGRSVISLYPLFKLDCAGLKFLVIAVVCLFVGAQIMFEYRCVVFLHCGDSY